MRSFPLKGLKYLFSQSSNTIKQQKEFFQNIHIHLTREMYTQKLILLSVSIFQNKFQDFRDQTPF